ncbi:alpha carbonic anhydrase [Geopyxis carbonaria]|nr:alpha carbonic anhydrase [Geopyxis carbonaria]
MYTQYLILIAGALAHTAHGSCIHGTSLHRRAEGAVEISNFGYTGLLGPQNWASLATENLKCSTGTTQSPINIEPSNAAVRLVTAAANSTSPTNTTAAAVTLAVDIPSVESAEFENLGTTVEVIVNGTTTLNGAAFALAQFHFHTPSEHRIAREYFPLELHMVHESTSSPGDILVIAVLFQLSSTATTSLLTAVTENIADIATPGTVTETGALDFAPLVEHLMGTPLFEYTGSLTTPPCAEGLTFLVTEVPLDLDVATFNAIKSIVRFNSRYTQNDLAQTNILQVGCEAAGFDGAAKGAASSVGDNGTVAPAVEKAVVSTEGAHGHECIFGACTPVAVAVAES